MVYCQTITYTITPPALGYTCIFSSICICTTLWDFCPCTDGCFAQFLGSGSLTDNFDVGIGYGFITDTFIPNTHCCTCCFIRKCITQFMVCGTNLTKPQFSFIYPGPGRCFAILLRIASQKVVIRCSRRQDCGSRFRCITFVIPKTDDRCTSIFSKK